MAKIVFKFLPLCLSLGLLSALLLGQTGPALAADQPTPFGSDKPEAFSLVGDIYFLPHGTGQLPNFDKLKPVGKVYATELNITKRNFTEGFPGITGRYEWFAIDYQGTFMIEKPGRYNFQLSSDDGSRLYIDDELVIDLDGVHEVLIRDAVKFLDHGIHHIRVQYFQGPRYKVALVLKIAGRGEELRVYSTKEMAPPAEIMEKEMAPLAGILEKVEIIEGEEEIRVIMSNAVLFDFDKFDLKPEALPILFELKRMLFDAYPESPLIVEGHTDSVGSEEYNIELSKRRARSVLDWMLEQRVDPERIEAIAYGESKPKFPNTTAENRAKNRRVEIRLIK